MPKPTATYERKEIINKVVFDLVVQELAKYIYHIFPAANERTGLENIDQSQRREF
jgi:hypothetical protein